MTAKELAEKIFVQLQLDSTHEKSCFSWLESFLDTALREAATNPLTREASLSIWDRDSAVQHAVLAERERCAKIAESEEDSLHAECDGVCGCACQEKIAQSLREK